MKTLALITTLFTLTLNVQAYLFSNAAGKSIEADITKANETHVWLRLASGKISKVSRDKLVKEDKEHIDEWIADRLPDIRVEPKLIRRLSKEKRTYYERRFKQSLSFSVKLNNYSADRALEECEVIYYFIGRSTENKKQFKVLARQVRTAKVLPNGSNTVSFTDMVNHFGDDDSWSGGQHGHRGIDYVLHVKRQRDGRTVHLSSPTILLEKNKESIVMLSQGDVTGDDFLKARKVVDTNGKETEEPEKPTPIIIK